MVFLTEKERFENLIPIEGIPLIYSGFPDEETGKKKVGRIDYNKL